MHQPKLHSNPLWYPNGLTFTNRNLVGMEPLAIFIDKSDTIYVADNSNGSIRVWVNGHIDHVKTYAINFSYCWSLFVTLNGDIYYDHGGRGQVGKWSFSENTSAVVLEVGDSCAGLFVDNENDLYCSIWNGHKVLKKSLNRDLHSPIVVAGTGIAGRDAMSLDNPRGIFIGLSFNLYIADCFNHRIQMFQVEQRQGKTLVGNGAPETFELSYPTGVVIDGGGFVFVVDNNHHRIVASNTDGFRCLVGCSNQYGMNQNRLFYPYSMAFDTHGNMFVTDQNNHRIQKFILAENRSSKYF